MLIKAKNQTGLNTLVLCTGNSARSILLEVILRDQGKGLISAFSAGSHPVGRVHPLALDLLKQKGHSIEGLHSKSWDVFTQSKAPKMDLVITVCGNANKEVCPIWLGQPTQVHWGVEDPAAEAHPDRMEIGFERAYAQLFVCAEQLLAENDTLLKLDHLAQRATEIRLGQINDTC